MAVLIVSKWLQLAKASLCSALGCDLDRLTMFGKNVEHFLLGSFVLINLKTTKRESVPTFFPNVIVN